MTNPLCANMFAEPMRFVSGKDGRPLSARNGLALLSSQNICKTELCDPKSFKEKIIKGGDMFFKKKIKCPYCQSIFDKMPTRKKKCPHCQSFIFVKDGKLITEKEAEELDERRRIINKLREFNILEKDYESRKEILAKKRGFEPKYFDIIWDLSNKKTMELANAKNFNSLKDLYYQMALFLNEEGKDFFRVLQQSSKTELENMKTMDIDIKEVEIMSVGGCSSCEELNGKKFTIEEALEKMPIPNKNCSNKNFNNFCRCIYQPIINRGEEEKH